MRSFEFWPPRVFEAPYYLYLVLKCARRMLPIKYLAKANYALDHGELGLGSKYTTQMAFAQNRFLPTTLLEAYQTPSALEQTIDTFVQAHGYPVVLKPDIGALGKGVMKIRSKADAERVREVIQVPFLLQAFSPFTYEYGVFFTRKKGVNRITGINKKHFPSVVGNGHDTIAQLAASHYRFTDHWRIFLKYIDTERIPDEGEHVQLSFIGSHTMGCKFTDDTHLVTPALKASLFSVCDSQPGFNFGRLDVKAESEEAFREGQFVVIEVNGVASLPTHMFDPANTLHRAYQIFMNHGSDLVDIANEHRSQPMNLSSYSEIWRLAKSNSVLLNDIHDAAMSS